MDHFTHLPFELTSGILTHLAVPHLLVLLRVNKKLNQLGEQIHYQDLELIWSRENRAPGRLAPQSSFVKLHTVLFNILRLPQRAAYVKHLHIDVGNLENVWNVWGPTGEMRMTEAERELLRGAIFPASLDSTEGAMARGLVSRCSQCIYWASSFPIAQTQIPIYRASK